MPVYTADSRSPMLYDSITGKPIGYTGNDGKQYDLTGVLLGTNTNVPLLSLDPTAGLLLGGAAPNEQQRAAVRAGIGAAPEISVSIFKYIPVGEHAAIQARTSAYDCTDAFTSAISAATLSGAKIEIPSGTYLHSGITVPTGVKLTGNGVGSTILMNIDASNDSITIPYNDDGNFPKNWEVSNLTIDALTPKQAGQDGLVMNVCSGGLVSNIHVKNHYRNVVEKTVWKVGVQNVLSSAGEYGWDIEDGVTTPGTPNRRYGVDISDCAYGLRISGKGVGATSFFGGSVERSTNWAISITGNENRAVMFYGFNFEANNNASNGFDVVIGSDADAASGPSCVGFDGCIFNDTTGGAARIAFDLNRGNYVAVRNCAFINYLRGADVSGNFGQFHLENNTGIASWCESSTVGVYIPGPGLVVGTKAMATTVQGGVFRQVHLDSAASPLIASRRTTESQDRFSIDGGGKIKWHAFNVASPDTTFGRGGVGVLTADQKLTAVSGIGVGNSVAATETIGKAVVKKIEVFDAAGVSIGYLPVYSAIS